MRIVNSLFFLLLTYCIHGQSQSGLILEYNLYDNEVKYSRNGAEVLKPSLQEGENLYIHISEFNPYVMTADVEVNKGSYSQSSLGYNSDSYQGESSSISGISSLLGGLSLGNSISSIFENMPGSRGATTLEVAQAKQKFNTMVYELSEIEDGINISRDKIEMVEKVEASRNLALNDIHQLKTNTLIKPSRIKTLIEEEIMHSFAKSKNETVDINDLLDNNKLLQEFDEAVISYNQKRVDYINMAGQWKDFNGTLNIMELLEDDMQFAYIKSASDSILQEINLNIESKLTEPLKTNIDMQDRANRTLELAEFRRVLEEIQSDIFVYKFPPVQAKGELMKVNITIQLDGDTNGENTFKKLTQEVPVVGGWKITGGVGLAFGALKDPSFSYSALNGIIVADENDQFIPMITSFAHIHRKSSKSINLGGSFGVGFPISGGSGLSSASFFLGPTIVIGKQQKFLITAGVMGSKVDRLGGGMQIGDPIEALTSTIPIQSKYELGYFIGISYDIIK